MHPCNKFVPDLGINCRVFDRGVRKNDGIGISPYGWIQWQVSHQVMVAIAILFVQGTAKAIFGQHCAGKTENKKQAAQLGPDRNWFSIEILLGFY